MTRRVATTTVVVLVLFVTALPAAGACCLGKPDTMAAMHASMPCCAANCPMSSPSTGRDHDVALISPASPQTATPTVTALTTPVSPAPVSIAAAANDGASIESTAPPPFLLHRQFRI
jgi:hypothetical protein